MNEWDERKMRVAGVDSTYVVVSIILIFLFGLGLCALEGSFINYDLANEVARGYSNASVRPSQSL
jgi:hypothetical protein